MHKFAVIGKGFIYPRHEQAIQANGGEVIMTCDIDPAKGADFLDWVEMFNHPKFKEVEFVSICTPNYLHSIMTREALLKGKKVLCEKPLSINGTQGMEGVKTVLQLRHNPAVQHLHQNPPESIHVEARMFRDEKYWNSWKGNEIMSGGVLYNLGVHYIDLLVYIMGEDWDIQEVQKTNKRVSGKINFLNGSATFHIEIVDDKSQQGRVLVADGAEIVLSNQENLSYEDLHKDVYRDFIDGRGIDLDEARKGLDLIREILSYN